MKKYLAFLLSILLSLAVLAPGASAEAPYVIKIDYLHADKTTRYDTLEEAEAAAGFALELPAPEEGRTRRYYITSGVLRVHDVHFSDEEPYSEDGVLMRDIDENVVFLKAPWEMWDLYAEADWVSRNQVVYVWDYPVLIQSYQGKIQQASWFTGDYGYIIAILDSNRDYTVQDIVGMVEIMSAQDAQTPFTPPERTVETLQEVRYATLAQAEEAAGFEIDLPEMEDSFVPAYKTRASNWVVSGSPEDEKHPVYQLEAAYTQYEFQPQEHCTLRRAGQVFCFLKATLPPGSHNAFHVDANKRLFVYDYPIDAQVEDGKVMGAIWNTNDYSYAIYMTGKGVEEAELIRMAEQMTAADHERLTEHLAQSESTSRTIEALNEKNYPTLAEAEDALGFQFTQPQIREDFLPRYTSFAQMDYVFEEGQSIDVPIFGIMVEYRHNIVVYEKDYAVTRADQQIYLRKFQPAPSYLMMPEPWEDARSETVTVNSRPVQLNFQGDRPTGAEWESDGFGYQIYLNKADLTREELLQMVEEMK